MYGLAFAASAAGLVVVSLSGELVPLLALAALVFRFGGQGPGLLSAGVFAAIAASHLLGAGRMGLFEPDASLRLMLFVATALVIGIVAGSAPRRSGGLDPAIAELIPGLAWSADATGRLLSLNRRFLRYLDVTDIGSFRYREAIHPDDLEETVDLWLRCQRNGEEFHSTHRIRGRDGIYRWFRSVARPRRDRHGKVTGWYGTMIDINDQKVAEEALRASEASLRSTLDNIPGMIAAADAEGNHNYANKRNLEYFRFDVSNLAGSGWLNIIHPDDRDGVAAAWQHSVRTGEPMDVVHRLRRFDGEYRWFNARVEPVFEENGKVQRWYGLITDIDDRKRAEEALRDRTRQLQLLVDTIPTLVWATTPDGEPAYMNRRISVYYGLTLDEIERVEGSKLTGAIRARVHPDDAPAVEKAMRHSFETGQSFAMRYRNLRADGVYRWVDGRAEPLRDDDDHIVQWYGVCIDIDDERRAQEALRAAQDRLSRASHLATLAELSASIAHEVNQPLTALIGNSDACQRWLSAAPPNIDRARMTAARIVGDAMAAADVVRRIRALFMQKAPPGIPIDLNEVIGEVRELMIDRLDSEGVLIETDLDQALPPTVADRVQMQQVLVNLIRNAIDAMKSNAGTPKSLVIESRRNGEDTVLIEVRDNGNGIAEPDRIFEPFFTTKDGGMGMGLSICRSIIESHHGRMWAASLRPRGAAFSFTLPAGPRDIG